jgi:hypothetical protein
VHQLMPRLGLLLLDLKKKHITHSKSDAGIMNRSVQKQLELLRSKGGSYIGLKNKTNLSRMLDTN